MTLCKSNNHDYKHFNDKQRSFIAAQEPSNNYGVCIKCGKCISGNKPIRRIK